MTIAATNLHWGRPTHDRGTGVLVLAGSSGRLDSARAEVLARAGATALALRWFGGAEQPPTSRRRSHRSTNTASRSPTLV